MGCVPGPREAALPERRISSGSFSAERAALRRAPGRVPYAVIALCVLLVVGVLSLMMSGDEQRVHRELGRRINRAKTQGFDPFLVCALQQDPDSFASNADLSARIVERARTDGPAFARELQHKCLPMLDAVDDKLAILIAPDTIKDDLGAMIRSVGALRESFTMLATDLMNEQTDEAKVRKRAARIARPWYDFRRAHSAINHTLREKLQSSQ